MDGIYGYSLCLENGAVASMVTGIISYIALHFYNEAYGYLFGIHTVVACHSIANCLCRI
ncbi:hypothetical protein SAMN05518872_103358 [Psychrobacillus sp. OK032]|nr:hypothetical protein SAMN05518872_103358 [Psychrobacillus sp. OK032]